MHFLEIGDMAFGSWMNVDASILSEPHPQPVRTPNVPWLTSDREGTITPRAYCSLVVRNRPWLRERGSSGDASDDTKCVYVTFITVPKCGLCGMFIQILWSIFFFFCLIQFSTGTNIYWDIVHEKRGAKLKTFSIETGGCLILGRTLGWSSLGNKGAGIRRN